MHIIILAIDQATHKTGFCVADTETGELIAFGTVIANSKKDTANRISDIKKWIVSAVEKYNADKVILEDIQFQNNNKIFKVLAHLQGVIIDACVENKIPFKIVSPSTWKKAVGIKHTKRKEEKECSIVIASDAAGEKVHEDTADAICIALSEIGGTMR